jgi:hypothetical protein
MNAFEKANGARFSAGAKDAIQPTQSNDLFY